ncbi:MAG TPA: hypothetical protein VMB48_01970 [Steroidobacteraceae bacterium]|nr:hypothetical protein [Steroidobacteraceae bacterium]
MRPLTVLIGILMGSAFTLFFGLSLTWVTLLFLPRDQARELVSERAPLLLAIFVFALLAAVSGVSFYGQIRERLWRQWAHMATVAVLVGSVWLYWPRR